LFSPTEEQSAHDLAGNLGAIFELMSQELDQKNHNKIFGGGNRANFCKKIFPCMALPMNDSFPSKGNQASLYIDASH
jgi:hypothetical protein